MKLSLYYPRLRTFIERYVSIHSWLLNTPLQPGQINGFISPIYSTVYTLAENNQISAQGSQELVFTYLLPDTQTYSSINLGTAQALQNDLSIRLVAASEELGLNHIHMRGGSTDFSETDVGLGDWLVTVRIPIGISWQAELETGTLTDKTFNQVLINLYRNRMVDSKEPEKDFNDVSLRQLDRTIRIP